MDEKKLDVLIMELFSLKGKTGYTEFDVITWRKHLREYDEKDLIRAFNNCLQKEGFFEIKMVLDELTPNQKELSLDAWNQCMDVAKDGGKGLDKLDDNTLNALRLAGGINKLRRAESDYVRNMMQKTFIECYDVSAKQQGRLLIK